MEYSRPPLLFNRHLETIYPSLGRKVLINPPVRERINTPDRDFLDVDWYLQNSTHLVIISHGLEGNSFRPYVLGMASAFLSCHYDVLAWNYRGCSGEVNKLERFYHSGATEDLECVISHALITGRYNAISLIGFSLGGNLTLKFLGEQSDAAKHIQSAVAISAPLDLASSCQALAKPVNWLYVNRFLISLKRKVADKKNIMPLPINTDLERISTLREFDDQVTAPLHGFKDASDYYAQNSSLPYLKSIGCKTLILNALNDPFLSPECFPMHVKNPLITFLYPKQGGHVGFTLINDNNLYWSEIQATRFITGG